MAVLFPADFDLSSIEKAEKTVIDAFVTQLDDSWYVVPSIPVVSQGSDYEIDVALISHDHGMFLVEVKGGLITVENGKWKSYDHVIKNPFQQITKAKHGLVRRLGKNKTNLEGVFIQHLVAFPDIVDFPKEGAGPEAPREIVLTSTDLKSPMQILSPLRHGGEIVSRDKVVALLKALKPNLVTSDVNGDYITGATQRIDKTSVNELQLLFGLDENRRIYLRGRAGTGKTFLAHHWAKRAIRRGERTLLVCFNRALGNDLYENLVDFAESRETPHLLRAGSFHSIANSLLGERAVVVPDELPTDFWTQAHATAIMDNIDLIKERFDTIIVDEGQDFQPNWYRALEMLLADSESSRMYVTFDEEQAIFASPPEIPAGAVLFRLTQNVRSTKNVAAIGAALGGARAHHHSPIGPAVDIFTVGGKKERGKRIVQSLTKITEKLDIPLSQILVLVPHNNDVVELTAEPLGDFHLAPWENRDEGTITCATIQKTKGLERLAVVLVSLDDEVDQQVTYVGLTRASAYLAVIGSENFIASLTTQPSSPTSADAVS